MKDDLVVEWRLSGWEGESEWAACTKSVVGKNVACEILMPKHLELG